MHGYYGIYINIVDIFTLNYWSNSTSCLKGLRQNNDIALCTGHYNNITWEDNSLIYPLICSTKNINSLYIVDLISFTSGIEYFTFQQSFKSCISGLILVLNCCYSVVTHCC